MVYSRDHLFKSVKLRDRGSVFIRSVSIGDILSIHKMYESLSDESKKFFYPGFIGLKLKSLKWLFAQIDIDDFHDNFSKRIFDADISKIRFFITDRN